MIEWTNKTWNPVEGESTPVGPDRADAGGDIGATRRPARQTIRRALAGGAA